MVQVTLGEGNTPMVESARTPGVWFKLETSNPTGSYKDRFAAGEIGRVVGEGLTAVVATSSGNTGAALAACSARYGIRCTIVVAEDAPAGKLMQMQAHGAQVIRVPGFTVDPQLTIEVMDLLKRVSVERGMALAISAYRYCPVGMQRVESIGAEITGKVPKAHIFVPVGGGGLCSAVIRGCVGTGAKVYAVQPERCNTVVTAWERGVETIEAVQSSTKISGLSVPFDIDASLLVKLLKETGGKALTVSDEAVWSAQGRMLSEEGIYCEPAGATALAGALRARELGWIADGDEVVCLVTGHGFKDPNSIAAAAGRFPDKRVDAGGLLGVL